ncbi:MAG: hypothetical protein ISS66_17915, partial [Desulfobacteraceae bacterium]|nr:hypothetical protein [Desulfobacteraceae bacterium]
MKVLQTSVLVLTLGLLVSLWGTTFAQEEVPQDTVVVAEVDEFTALIQKSETLHDQKKYNETFEVLKEAEKLNPEDPELLWRLARAHFDIADQSDDEAVHKEHFYPGLDYAKRAVKLDPNSAKAHKWYAILIGKIGLM